MTSRSSKSFGAGFWLMRNGPPRSVCRPRRTPGTGRWSPGSRRRPRWPRSGTSARRRVDAKFSVQLSRRTAVGRIRVAVVVIHVPRVAVLVAELARGDERDRDIEVVVVDHHLAQGQRRRDRRHEPHHAQFERIFVAVVRIDEDLAAEGPGGGRQERHGQRGRLARLQRAGAEGRREAGRQGERGGVEHRQRQRRPAPRSSPGTCEPPARRYRSCRSPAATGRCRGSTRWPGPPPGSRFRRCSTVRSARRRPSRTRWPPTCRAVRP